MPCELKHSCRISKALVSIKERWPASINLKNDSEYPVFILSAGWRSGSTLMQRLIISSNKVAIWGEPLGDAAIIPRLAYSISVISRNWPSDNFFNYDPDLSRLSGQWIANLTPDVIFLRLSHRAFFKDWLGNPAKERFGVERWGLKEVRLTIDHAQYLKWLFPKARFIFIYRNLFDAYRSWKGNRWRSVWPGYYSNSPVAFARHWRYLLEGFIRGYQDVDGLLVKFEDLISNKIDLDDIANYIGVKKLDHSILVKKIGSPRPELMKTKMKLNFYERYILSIIGHPLLGKSGYTY